MTGSVITKETWTCPVWFLLNLGQHPYQTTSLSVRVIVCENPKAQDKYHLLKMVLTARGFSDSTGLHHKRVYTSLGSSSSQCIEPCSMSANPKVRTSDHFSLPKVWDSAKWIYAWAYGWRKYLNDCVPFQCFWICKPLPWFILIRQFPYQSVLSFVLLIHLTQCNFLPLMF